MEKYVSGLVQAALTLSKEKGDSRVLIAIVGIPGSGKSTLAYRVAKSPRLPRCFPWYGYHLSRNALDLLPDPKEAHARRGAPFTFDPTSLLDFAKLLKSESPPITKRTAPSFDHAVKDPTPNAIPINPTHRIIIFEGLYLALDFPIWRDIAESMDQIWFIEVPREVARRRLIARHVAAGIVKSGAEGAARADENDLPNGDLIIKNLLPVNKTIPYVEDPEYAEAVTKAENEASNPKEESVNPKKEPLHY
ncbi:P-loop containing nucleoside triphosphate hydrolase protein [Kalaharituber pfeilii]|nr:P-loop containing nucleoside triphosphate hydrolase protein [Kalaharituber pfeilii]